MTLNEEREKLFLAEKKKKSHVTCVVKRKHICRDYVEDADMTFLKPCESFKGITKDIQTQEQGEDSAVVTSHGYVLSSLFTSLA
jgi:hypothetical protein